MKPCDILRAFRDARREHVCNNTQTGASSWVEVFAIFAGNVTERMTVLADGSDIVQAVMERQRKLKRKFPAYEFPFNGFQKP
jgi:hypothetical protein